MRWTPDAQARSLTGAAARGNGHGHGPIVRQKQSGQACRRSIPWLGGTVVPVPPGDRGVSGCKERLLRTGTGVRGHEKVPTGGQVSVPVFGQLEVPVPRVSCQGLWALCGDGVGVSQIPVTAQGAFY